MSQLKIAKIGTCLNENRFDLCVNHIHALHLVQCVVPIELTHWEIGSGEPPRRFTVPCTAVCFQSAGLLDLLHISSSRARKST